MYLKYSRHEDSKGLNFAATDKIELPESGKVSAILLDFQLKGSSVQNVIKRRIVDHLTKVEVTDGGTKTMFSLTGQCAKAAAFFQTKQIPHESAILYGNHMQRTTIPIMFGEFVGDPKYALDLGAYDQVNVDISNDLTSSGFDSTVWKTDVTLVVMEDLPAAPAKYYKTYQWRAEKPAADGQFVRHQLPTTEKIRRYFAQFDPDLLATGLPTADPRGDAYLLDFSFQERKEYVWKGANIIDVARANSLIYGKPETHHRHGQGSITAYDTALARVENLHLGPMGDTAWSSGAWVFEESNERFGQFRTWPTGPEMADIYAIGQGYYDAVVMFDANSGDEAYFLDPSKSGKGPVYLDWYGSADDHTVRSIVTVPMKNGEA